ncbi:MAG TPA: pyruvate kinase [Treponema sp.]|nr:pyruvate kinase [Treponema sp.]
MFLRKTKIVCSLGPTAETLEVISELLRSGMNVARFNFSHGTHEYHLKNMHLVREASRLTGIPCALLMDTKGPEIRTGIVCDSGLVEITEGDIVLLTNDDGLCYSPKVNANGEKEPTRISLSWKALPKEIKKDCRILIADGLVELLVLDTDGEATITCEALNSGSFGSRKNVNVIGVRPQIPVLSEQDKIDIAFAIQHNVDFIAASFISDASDIVSILRYIEPFNSNVRVIAKIENEEGLDNIAEIVTVSAGVMVARGDLGVQLATERIPLAQKKIIRECNIQGKPVITATQMLDSMIHNPRPTRAELTDVANAIFDGTDAVMLSGETANGAYPVEAVQTMAKIALTVEASEEYRQKMRSSHFYDMEKTGIQEVLAKSAYQTAVEIEAQALLAPTLSGNTARLLSRFRPEQAIIAATPNEAVQRQLLLNWGVVPFLVGLAEDSEEMIQNAIRVGLEKKQFKMADKLVVVAGVPIISPIMVNTIRVLVVGNIIARGANAGGTNKLEENADFPHRVTGRVVHAETPEAALAMLRKKGGEILVTKNLDMSFVPILRIVNGLVVENPSDLTEEMLEMINPHIVWISQVPKAMAILEQGLTITLDSKEKLVYEGSL